MVRDTRLHVLERTRDAAVLTDVIDIDGISIEVELKCDLRKRPKNHPHPVPNHLLIKCKSAWFQNTTRCDARTLLDVGVDSRYRLSHEGYLSIGYRRLVQPHTDRLTGLYIDTRLTEESKSTLSRLVVFIDRVDDIDIDFLTKPIKSLHQTVIDRCMNSPPTTTESIDVRGHYFIDIDN